jgi:hypothetical protein
MIRFPNECTVSTFRVEFRGRLLLQNMGKYLSDYMTTRLRPHIDYWWADDIKMDLGEIGWGDMDWIGVTQDRDQWK